MVVTPVMLLREVEAEGQVFKAIFSYMLNSRFYFETLSQKLSFKVRITNIILCCCYCLILSLNPRPHTLKCTPLPLNYTPTLYSVLFY